MKNLILGLVLVLVISYTLSGCVFSGYGIKAETENNIIINAEEKTTQETKSFNAVISLKESQSEHLQSIVKDVMQGLKDWWDKNPYN